MVFCNPGFESVRLRSRRNCYGPLFLNFLDPPLLCLWQELQFLWHSSGGRPSLLLCPLLRSDEWFASLASDKKSVGIVDFLPLILQRNVGPWSRYEAWVRRLQSWSLETSVRSSHVILISFSATAWGSSVFKLFVPACRMMVSGLLFSVGWMYCSSISSIVAPVKLWTAITRLFRLHIFHPFNLEMVESPTITVEDRLVGLLFACSSLISFRGMSWLWTCAFWMLLFAIHRQAWSGWSSGTFEQCGLCSLMAPR